MDNRTHLIQKYSMQVPRYTSYPTAPHFDDSVTSSQHSNFIERSDLSTPLSIYFHIPFCEKLCWYCGCSMKIVNSYSPIKRYTEALIKEIEMVREHFESPPSVSHIHFGGGTPTVLEPNDADALFNAIHTNFSLSNNTEIAMEGDPRTMSHEKAINYKKNGINRMSFGLQDFNPKVQEAINRVQPYPLVSEVLKYCREAGLDKINIDMMYGLPFQTLKNFRDSMEKALSLAPDRIALFGYAHVPWMKKHMKLIPDDTLPDAALRMELFNMAAELINKQGYVAVGLDHFVKTSDTMARAFDDTKLNRNFQGYTTDQATNLIALGASAISSFEGRGYTQNAVATKEYEEQINNNNFATYRGISLSPQDALQAAIIKEIMCYYEVNLNNIAKVFNVGVDSIARNETLLSDLENDNIITIKDNIITLHEDTRMLVRVVASAFDTYFTASQKRHSQAV